MHLVNLWSKKMSIKPIYEGQDFYVPAFEVFVDKKKQGKNVSRDILQVSYKDNIKGYDTFDITISNWDAEKRKFKYSDSKSFDPGKIVELKMGYYGNLQRMIEGPITSLQPSYPAGGQPTLKISGKNLLYTLRRKQETVKYEKMKDSQIAQIIGQRLKIKVDTSSEAEQKEVKYDYLLQKNEYDIVFLMERAKENDYELYIKEGKDGKEDSLYFGPSQTGCKDKVYKLEYGRSLIQFQPNLNVTDLVGEVTVEGWDTKKRKRITHTARLDQLVTEPILRFKKSFTENKEIKANQPMESIAEARNMANKTLLRIAKGIMTGSGTTVGVTGLRAGIAVEISGLGELFSGCYFVTSTTHTINDSGYTVQFECRREDIIK